MMLIRQNIVIVVLVLTAWLPLNVLCHLKIRRYQTSNQKDFMLSENWHEESNVMYHNQKIDSPSSDIGKIPGNRKKILRSDEYRREKAKSSKSKTKSKKSGCKEKSKNDKGSKVKKDKKSGEKSKGKKESKSKKLKKDKYSCGSPSATPINPRPSLIPTIWSKDNNPSYGPSLIELPTIEPSPSTTPPSQKLIFPSGNPSYNPSAIPSPLPPTAIPTNLIKQSPSSLPSEHLSHIPSSSPSTIPADTLLPSLSPSRAPLSLPSDIPSDNSSDMPTLSRVPSRLPSNIPTHNLTNKPFLSRAPSSFPSDIPSDNTSDMPTLSRAPSRPPSDVPIDNPTHSPTLSLPPSSNPSNIPSNNPSDRPTDFFDISICSSYNTKWLLDLARSCNNDYDSPDCECRDAISKIDNERIVCGISGGSACPTDCDVCSRCLNDVLNCS